MYHTLNIVLSSTENPNDEYRMIFNKPPYEEDTGYAKNLASFLYRHCAGNFVEDLISEYNKLSKW